MHGNISQITAIIMARRPSPGTGKSRLAQESGLEPEVIAEVARAMLKCTIQRISALWRTVLALTPAPNRDDLCRIIDNEPLINQVAVVSQGNGTLGNRMERAWKHVEGRPICFLGSDTPDVPLNSLLQIQDALQNHDVAMGPSHDGGYWTLACRDRFPQLLREIDWGGPMVYDQTRRRAADAGLTVFELPAWPDVDRLTDLLELRQRLGRINSATADLAGDTAGDPIRNALRMGTLALVRLRDRLTEILGPTSIVQGPF